MEYYGAGKAGGTFDVQSFVLRPPIIARFLCWLFVRRHTIFLLLLNQLFFRQSLYLVAFHLKAGAWTPYLEKTYVY